MKLRNRWVRVGTQRQLVVVRKEKVGCSLLLEGMLRKCRLFWHVFFGMFGMFGMLWHVCERGNDDWPRPEKAEVVSIASGRCTEVCRFRALVPVLILLT